MAWVDGSLGPRFRRSPHGRMPELPGLSESDETDRLHDRPCAMLAAGLREGKHAAMIVAVDQRDSDGQLWKVASGLLGAPACDRSLAGNLTSPSSTQFFCPRSSAFQPSEFSQRHRMWIFSSLRHALERARALPRENINEFRVLLRFPAEQSSGARPERVKNARLLAAARFFSGVSSGSTVREADMT